MVSLQMSTRISHENIPGTLAYTAYTIIRLYKTLVDRELLNKVTEFSGMAIINYGVHFLVWVLGLFYNGNFQTSSWAHPTSQRRGMGNAE
jgi:hypothetical protein